MSYRENLPRAFPFCIEQSHRETKLLVYFLMDFDRNYTPNGSSFAVTSDTTEGNSQLLWLSNISYHRLLDAELIEGWKK